MISEAEWQVLKIIWMRPHSTSADLIKILKQKFAWSPSTVKTLLKRLLEKGAVKRKKIKKSFEYSAILTEDESTDFVVASVKDRLCSKRIPSAIEKLVRTSDLTMSDIESIKQLLDRKEAVSAITCHCMD